VLADDMTSVGFAISYWRDEGICFEEILDGANRRVPETLWNVQTTDGKVLWTETLTTAAFGVATVIVGARTAGHLPGEPDPALEVRDVAAGEPEQRGSAFYGLAHPNPSFLYRGVDELEVLIQIPSAYDTPPSDDGRRIGDALRLSEAVRVVSSVAARHELPLMLVQSPMAAPPANEYPWPLAQAPGVRCGIAMPTGGIEHQLDIYKEVHRWAEDMGCALHIGDRRGDGRRGLWHQLSAGDRSAYERKIVALPRAAEPLELVVPVTFVGPARVGTTAAIMNYLAGHRVPVLSVSVMPLENMAFISLLIGLANGMSDAFSHPSHGSAGEVLASIGKLRLTGWATTDEENDEVTAAAPRDYRACMGGAMEVTPLDRNKRALWASWQFPEEIGAPHTAISQLRAAAEQEVGPGGVTVQYVVCRRGDAQDLRGRCKLAVSAEVEPAAAAERRGHARGELCRRIESRWRTLLGRGAPRSIIDVDVTWEESRLGRWLSPPGGARGDVDVGRDASDAHGATSGRGQLASLRVVGPVGARMLATVGIEHPTDVGDDPRLRVIVADQLAIPHPYVMSLIDAVRVFSLPGMTVHVANLLERAGVGSLRAIADSEAPELQARLSALDGCVDLPDLAQLNHWVAEAQRRTSAP
jgi:Domain of unknown function (DUF4332)